MMAGSQIPLPRLGSGAPAHSGGSKREGSVWEQPYCCSQGLPSQGCATAGAVPLADVSCAMSLQRWAWYAVHDIVRSICKFRREMHNDKCRVEFEDFLRRELGNEEESMARLLPPPLLPPQDTPGFRQRSKWRKLVAYLPSPYADLVFSAGGI